MKNYQTTSTKPPHPWDWPIEPMDRAHIDFFEFKNNKFLAMVESYSKCIEIKVGNSWKAGNTIKTLKLWFSQFRIPKQLVSDNGVQFTSTEFKSFIEKNRNKSHTHSDLPPKFKWTGGKIHSNNKTSTKSRKTK